ncbi:MAG: DUF4340 domain-containing protein [Planctomycetia bacterium]|nr:DUF4340 domain-containing protein [Planctomycetia bacterium]
MNENTKTAVFVGAAVLLLAGAWMLRPKPMIVDPQADMGQPFFPDFEDPLSATTLEVVEFDNDTGMLRPFKVTQTSGVWSIPSHENYPADAKDHLAQAATAVIGLKKLELVSKDPSKHELYGVVDPDATKLAPGAEGVGKRVTLQDKNGNKLADFIIGKKDPDRPDLHFVRVPGQDPVYRVIVKTDKLSTKFQNWIEEDLLKLNAFDVKEVVLDDHNVDEVNGAVNQRSVTTVDFNSKDSKWNLEEMKVFDPATGKWGAVTLAEDEELDTQKLNDLKSALDDLKIVDVAHKPQGLSADLRASGDFEKNSKTAQALARRGFFFAKRGADSDALEIVSNEGEVRCGTSDGVEYVLRVGNIAGRGREDEEEDAAASEGDKKSQDDEAASSDSSAADKSADKEKKTGDAGVERYIMVTTRFRPELIAKPELQEVPEGPEAAEPASDKAEPKNESTRFQPGDENLLALAQPQGTTKAPPRQPTSKAPPAKSTSKPADAAKPAESKPADAKPADSKPADAPETTDKPAEARPATEEPEDSDAAEAAKAKAAKEAAAARKRIEDDNKRKQDDYDKKVAAGEKRVKELNDRFADWYFVISDKTYQKIHISQDQLIKKKTKPAGEGTGAADFDALQKLPK